MSLARALARFNRRFANPVMRLVAGRVPPLAIVHHRGRRSGREYSTPVLSVRTEDGLLFGIIYGRGWDWVQNVLAAGRGEVTRRGQTREYVDARVADDDEALPLITPGFRTMFRVLRVRRFVLVTGEITVRLPVETVPAVQPIPS